MKAGILFTGTGPILILSSYGSFTDPKFIGKLCAKGIKKFIVYEIAKDKVRQKYGTQFDAILKDLHQADDLRVLDYDGHHIFNSFSLKELGQPVLYEG